MHLVPPAAGLGSKAEHRLADLRFPSLGIKYLSARNQIPTGMLTPEPTVRPMTARRWTAWPVGTNCTCTCKVV